MELSVSYPVDWSKVLAPIHNSVNSPDSGHETGWSSGSDSEPSTPTKTATVKSTSSDHVPTSDWSSLLVAMRDTDYEFGHVSSPTEASEDNNHGVLSGHYTTFGDMTADHQMTGAESSGQSSEEKSSSSSSSSAASSPSSSSSSSSQGLVFTNLTNAELTPCTASDYETKQSRDHHEGNPTNQIKGTEHDNNTHAQWTYDHNGEMWRKTRAGFEYLPTGGGNVQVKVGKALYDINVNADINIVTNNVTNNIHIKTEQDSSDGYSDGASTNDTDARNNNNHTATATTTTTTNNHNHTMGNCLYGYPYNGGCNTCDQNRNVVAFVPDHDAYDHYKAEYFYDQEDYDCYHPQPRAACKPRRQSVTRTERLWEFIHRLLNDPQYNPAMIEWVDREDGTFHLNNSRAIAHMWGMRKSNGQMTYEKLSRALRYYYHRRILEPVLGKKLVYRFGPNAHPVWEGRVYHPQPGQQ